MRISNGHLKDQRSRDRQTGRIFLVTRVKNAFYPVKSDSLPHLPPMHTHFCPGAFSRRDRIAGVRRPGVARLLMLYLIALARSFEARVLRQ